jgi:polygalacturonase
MNPSLRSTSIAVLLGLMAAQTALGAHNVLDYGAIDCKEENTTIAFQNSYAFTQAIIAANYSDDREVVVPGGHTFSMMPIAIYNVRNLTFTIDGTILASQDYQSWNVSGKTQLDFWSIQDSEYINVRGSGTVDGQGYWWWMREYIMANKGRRPHLILF